MGENPEFIYNVGAPGLDNSCLIGQINRAALEKYLQIELVDPIIIITLHPATSSGDPTKEALAICEAIRILMLLSSLHYQIQILKMKL